MPRAIWIGAVGGGGGGGGGGSFGLVNVPVRMYSAIDTTDLEFELVHAKDGGRIGYQKYCKLEDKLVPDDEIVKGYEVRKGKVVLRDRRRLRRGEGRGLPHDRDRGVRPVRGHRPDLLRADVLPRPGERLGDGVRPLLRRRWRSPGWPASPGT